MSNLAISLSYLKKGLSVMPLWSPAAIKQSPGKFNDQLEAELVKYSRTDNPVPKEEYQKELPTPEEVTQWFTQYPRC
jgi:hypothetical protein